MPRRALAVLSWVALAALAVGGVWYGVAREIRIWTQ